MQRKIALKKIKSRWTHRPLLKKGLSDFNHCLTLKNKALHSPSYHKIQIISLLALSLLLMSVTLFIKKQNLVIPLISLIRSNHQHLDCFRKVQIINRFLQVAIYLDQVLLPIIKRLWWWWGIRQELLQLRDRLKLIKTMMTVIYLKNQTRKERDFEGHCIEFYVFMEVYVIIITHFY